MRRKADTPDRLVARLAEKQHGLATRRQLLEAGLSGEWIQRRLTKGSLLRVHRGVYRVGHRAPSVESDYLAAVLACGERAVLSGRAAAFLLGLLKGAAPRAEVTAATGHRLEGAEVRRSRLGRGDRSTWRGVPVTSVARTLVDLAGELEPDALARVCHEAGVQHGTTPRQVKAALARRGRVRGARALREIMIGETRVTLSGLEAQFLELLRQNKLALPETNRPAGGRRVDCRWPEQRLIVELDSFRFHRSRHAWEQDRRREREARALGDEFRRYTSVDVFDSPRLMLRELRALIPPVS